MSLYSFSLRQRAKLAEEEAAKAPESAASAFLAEQRAKYAPRGASKPSKAVKGKREEETLALLGRFKSKLFSSAKPTAEGEGSAVAAPAPAPATATRARAADERDPTLLGSDDEDDADWCVSRVSPRDKSTRLHPITRVSR